ncbi:MAG: HupE/UreJ family protein [Calditrichaceae bacterium]|nr:HupE/UreJ family protein [Calditrichia bacterium]NUQ43315.1 HupE/UreJ family protein [Calditrichaceae bacterium]
MFFNMEVEPDTLRAQFEMIAPEIGKELGIAPDPHTGRIEKAQLLAERERLFRYIRERCEVRINYFEIELQPRDMRFAKNQLGEELVLLSFRAVGAGNPRVLSFTADFTNQVYPYFECFGRVNYGGKYWNVVIEQIHQTRQIEFTPEGPGTWMQMQAFIFLGIQHIFIGADHILFLLGLILIGGRFRDLVKIVTSFTIAHSITLTLAALKIVNLPPRWIESAIALSIVYIAAENFFIKKVDYRWIVTGIFGLAHGFGFANVLGNLGLPAKGLAISLFSFNIGVEIGQVVIVALMLPLVWAVLKSRFKKQITWAMSGMILFFGITWFLERAFDLPVGLI